MDSSFEEERELGYSWEDEARNLVRTAVLPTQAKSLQDRIDAIKVKQAILKEYRLLQSLHLTEIQAQILEAITPDKIHGAALRELVLAYKVLKDKELVVEGKPTDIKGLVGFLVEIEKEDAALRSGISHVVDISYGTTGGNGDEDDEERLPRL